MNHNDKVHIRHEETDQDAVVLRSSVPGWESVGWTLVEDEGVAEEPKVEAPKAKNGSPAAPDTSKKE